MTNNITDSEEYKYVDDKIYWHVYSMYYILQAINNVWDRDMIWDIALAWDYSRCGYLDRQSYDVVCMVAKALGYNE